MPFIKSINEENTIAGFWKLEEPAESLLTVANLTEQERKQFESFTSERRKREFLASRILLTQMTGGTGKIVYDDRGRPSLGESSGYLSLSHSGSLAAVIISETPSGIDVEETSRSIEKIMPRFLSEAELKWIQMSADSRMAALLCWCAKEAVFKMIRQDNLDFRKHIHLDSFEVVPAGSIQAKAEYSGNSTRIILNYRFLENNAVVWCVE